MTEVYENIDFFDSLHLVVENLPNLFSGREDGVDNNSSDEDHHNSDHVAVKNLLADVLYNRSVQHLLALCNILGNYSQGYVHPETTSLYGKHVLTELLATLDSIASENDDAQELSTLLRNPHLRNILIAYDDISHGTFYPKPPSDQRSISISESFSRASSRTSQLGSHLPSKQASSTAGSDRNSVIRRVSNVSGASTPTTTQYREVNFSNDAVRGSHRTSTWGSTTSTLDRTPRVVTISRHSNEPLGITVARVDSFVDGQLRSDIVVERILADSLVDQQDVLRVGDVILAINDIPVDSTESLQRILKQTASTSVILQIIPGPRRFLSTAQAKDRLKSYVRTFFSYDPSNDTLLPTGNVGLSFEAGDILEVVDKSDPHYWQARRLGRSRIGLIPSSTLEERRKAFTPLGQEIIHTNGFNYCAGGTIAKKKSKKSKKLFRVVDAPVFSEITDIWSYEDVVQVPAMPLKCLILLGPAGVGRRSLKQLMCELDPQKFGYPTPDTTQTSALSNGNPCHYISRGQMEADIKNGLYLEWTEVGTELHGIRLQAIKDIIGQGKTVVLDCHPTSVRLLRQPEFNPHVVFITSPSVDVLRSMQRNGQAKGLDVSKRTDEDFRNIVEQSAQYERLYRHLYQSVLLNDNVPMTAKRLVSLVRRVERQPQWIPVAWEEELAPQHQLSVAIGAVSPIVSVPSEEDRSSQSSGRGSGSIRSEASQSQRVSVTASRNSSRMSNDVNRLNQQPSLSHSSQRSSVSKVSSVTVSSLSSQNAPSRVSSSRSPQAQMMSAEHSVIVTAKNLRVTPPQISVTNQQPLSAAARPHPASSSESSTASSTASSASTPRGGSGGFMMTRTSLQPGDMNKGERYAARPRDGNSESSSGSEYSDSSSGEEDYVQPKIANQSRVV